MDVARKRRWDRVLFWGFLVSLALVRAGHPGERDPYWQIRAGAENLAGIPLARPDTWSWSGVPGDWYPNSPLWNMALALGYQSAGFWGLFVLSAATILLLVSQVAVLGRRLGARPLPALVGLMVVLAAAFPMLSARATLAVQALLFLAVYLVLRLGERFAGLNTAALGGILFALAASMSILGNWLHLSFLLLSPGMALVWAVVWLLTPGLRAGRRWALILSGGAGWLLGPPLSPYGLATGVDRLRAVQAACQGLLIEWSSPLDPNVGAQFGFVLAVALVLAGLSTWWLYRRWRRGEDVRALAALAAIGVPAALAGFTAVRFLGVALIALSPVAAAGATRIVDWLRGRLRERPRSPRLRAKLQEYSAGRFWRVVLTAALVLLSPGVLLLAAPHAVPGESGIMTRLPAGCRMFSTPGPGGVAVLLRPDVPVWMDGRADFFGRDMLLRGYAYYAGLGPTLVPGRTGCVVLDTSTQMTDGLRAGLRASSLWYLDATVDGYELWLPGQTR